MLAVAELRRLGWGAESRDEVAHFRRGLAEGPGLEGRRVHLAGLERRQGLSKKPGAACPGMPELGDIVSALCSAPALLAIVTGAHQAPGLSTGCIFLRLHPSEKTSKTREMCFLLCLVSDSQHVASRGQTSAL